jgi:hypothetical protein
MEILNDLETGSLSIRRQSVAVERNGNIELGAESGKEE